MRMFLVGMCDVFLLLYLTALAQMEQRPASRLTVQDYQTLKAAHELLEKQGAVTKSAAGGNFHAIRKATVTFHNS